MTAELDVKELLDHKPIPSIDSIFTTNIPAEQVDETADTQILIRDDGSKRDYLGNDDFWGITQNVELQIFYAKNLQIDPTSIELQISQCLLDAGWDESSGWRGRILDPDTQQLMNTNYFTRTKIKED